MRRFSLSLATTLVLALTLFSTDARAETFAGTGEIEIYAGWFQPDEAAGSDLDDVTYGARLGYNFTDRFGITGTVGYWEADDTAFAGLFDVENLFVDLSFEYMVNPDDIGVFVLYAGPGIVSQDIVYVDPNDLTKNFAIEEEEFSFHAGVGVRISVSDRFYIRPDVRARWYEDNNPFNGSGEEVTWEASVGLGWYLGQP